MQLRRLVSLLQISTAPHGNGPAVEILLTLFLATSVDKTAAGVRCESPLFDGR